MAVLARVNASLAPVQVLLRHAGVPVNVAEGRFLHRGGVRAALAWLAVATAPDRALPGQVLREASRRPKRGMSSSLLDLVAKQRSVDAIASLAGWLDGKGSAREAGKMRDLAGDVAVVRKAADGGSTADVLEVVRSSVGDGGLDASAKALDKWSHGAIAAHGDDLDALVELAHLEPDAALFPGWLADQFGAPADPEGVTLASIHAVKGREWPHVVLHHATAGLMPHRLAEDVEEERRVFHVGLTRCRTTISLVPGSPPSKFLRELVEPGEPPAPQSTTRARCGRVPIEQRRRRRWRRWLPTRSRRSSGRGSPSAATTTRSWRSPTSGSGPGSARARPPRRSASARAVTVDGRRAVVSQPGYDTAWERLRAWRTERARAAGKPAFVVFDDKTLRTLAAVLPTTEAGLLAISGIGPVKLETYGDELMAIAEQLRAESAADA